MSIRYNVEIVNAGEESQENYLEKFTVVNILGKMKEGDALVINAVQGPGAGEL